MFFLPMGAANCSKKPKTALAAMLVLVFMTGFCGALFAADESAEKTSGKALEKAPAEKADEEADEDKALAAIEETLQGEDAEAKNAALKNLQKLAFKGKVKSQLLLAEIYAQGDKIFANDSYAWYWRKKAAENGSLEGQFKLANMYLKGIGAPFSLADAMKWYAKAALQNHVQSQKILGQIYMGKWGGSAIDFREAEKWLAKAAAQGDYEAEQAINEMYEGGYKPLPAGAPDPLSQPLPEEDKDQKTEAGRIREVLLDRLKKLPPHGGKFEMQGALHVKESDEGWFQVTVPPLKISGPRGWVLSLGRAKMKFKPVADESKPADDPKAYLVSGVEHNSVRFRPEAKGNEFIISYKVKRFAGVFVPAINAYSESDAELGDIIIRDSEQNFTAKAERLINVINLTESKPGVWGGSSRMALDGVAYGGQGAHITAKIKSVTLDYAFDGFDLKAFAAKFEAALASAAGESLDQSSGASAAAAPPFSFNSSVRAALNGLEVFDDGGKALGEAKRFNLNLAMNLDYPLLSLGASYAHAGLFYDADPEMSDYIPQNASASISIERLPLEDLFKAGVAWFLTGVAGSLSAGESQAQITASSSGGSPATAALSHGFAKKLFSRLEKNKALISIDANYDAAKSALLASGALKASAKALYGFAGKLDVMVRGLAQWMKAIEGKPEQAGSFAALSMLQKLAAAKAVLAGGDLDFYRLELTHKGNLLVNGKDLAGLYDLIKAVVKAKESPPPRSP